MEPVGVIDLGTNTFHLLVGSTEGTGIKVLHRKRYHVKLGRNGMVRIPAPAIKAALTACKHFRRALDDRGVSRVCVMGTAALRQADNAPDLVEAMQDILRVPVCVIDGDTEAKLIALGATMPLQAASSSRLVVDIGGGSVEFILLRDGETIWYRSYEIGVAVLKDRFHREDHIDAPSIASLHAFLDETLEELIGCVEKEGKVEIVGAAGVFELLGRWVGLPIHQGTKFIPLETLSDITERIVRMGQAERAADPRIPKPRTEHIVVALLLIAWIGSRLPISRMLGSPYSLKEGALMAWGSGGISPDRLPRWPWNNPSGLPREAF